MKSQKLIALLFAFLVALSICEHFLQLNIEGEKVALVAEQESSTQFFESGDLNSDEVYRASSGVSLNSEDGYSVCIFTPEHIVKSHTEIKTSIQYNLYLHSFYEKTSPPDLSILFRSILI